MFIFSLVKSGYMSGTLDQEGCKTQLANVMTSDVSYVSNYTPPNNDIQPFFQSRSGIDGLIALFEFEKSNGVHVEKIDDWGLDEKSISYTRSTTGRLLLEGPIVTWQHVFRVTFDRDGKIEALDYSVVDSEPIETAYP